MLVGVGALLVLIGVVVMTITTLKRGKLSEPKTRVPDAPRDTLEPTGRGRRLSLRADLPGISLVVAGALLLLIAAATRTAG